MKGLGFAKALTLIFTLSGLSNANATAQFSTDFQIWTDAHGLEAAAFCEVSQNPPAAVDSRITPYLDGSYQSSDGRVWRAAFDQGEPVTLDCLQSQTLKNYVLFEVLQGENQTEYIGVQPEEMQILKSSQRVADDLVPSTLPQMSQPRNVSPLVLPAGVEEVEGGLDYVVCISGKTLNVRDQSLDKVLFTAGRYDSVKPVQSFGTDQFKKTIGGVEYAFIKAQFPALQRQDNEGWVAEQYVRPRANCPGASPAIPPVSATPPDSPALVSTWTFPTIKRPTDSYRSGMRRFMASRSGRLHAACDLYRVTGEQAVAVSDGKVIRDRYYFYQGTYAIEIKQSGGKVARYGEITGKAAAKIGLNKTVKKGQTVGYVGRVNSNCCKPMLHFELYSGQSSGALTQSGGKFNRRKDLIDPTSLLMQWEKQTFGKSF